MTVKLMLNIHQLQTCLQPIHFICSTAVSELHIRSKEKETLHCKLQKKNPLCHIVDGAEFTEQLHQRQ